eukprot:2789087-Ditylum_brightwellii.AAC.1
MYKQDQPKLLGQSWSAGAFYTGFIASQIVKEVKNEGGKLSTKDFEEYRPIEQEPLISDDIKGFTITTAPPPSLGGAVVIGALKFFSGYSQPCSTVHDILSLHRQVEAMIHTFTTRMSMSDPAFGVVNGILSQRKL